MADSKITALASISTSTDPAVDPLVIVDVSDTSMAATGTTKKVTLNNLLSSSPTATGAFSVTGLVTAGSATITGDLTVDTSTLKVDSANDRVGIQSTLLNSRLTVRAGTIAGIDIYRDDSNANFSGIRFKGTTNSTVNAQIGWNGTQIRIDGTDEVLLVTNSSDRFRITTGGVFTWENVGGVAGTAMTLNSTGLGVGVSPRAKLDVNGGLLVNNYPTSNNYAPLSVKTTSAITTPSTFTNAINIYNTTNVGDYSNITFGYNALGLTNASAYIGFVSTSSAAGGFGDLVFGTRDVGTDTAATERVRIDASGRLLVGSTATGTAGAVFKVTGTVSDAKSFEVYNNSSAVNPAFWCPGSGLVNGVATGASSYGLIIVNKDSGNLRSISAAGSLNASGADYAEYMTKSGDFVIAKGDVAGIDANGKLTNVFADAVSFVVKSTDPSYVGNDKWGVDLEGDTLEAARQLVDRVAFAGQVPVNVTGAKAGDYIVPVVDGTGIKGISVSNPTFDQYKLAVGKVITIDADGRARIIVKVA
jgi:hypothetical protein